MELECRDNECVDPIPPSTIRCESNADCAAFFDENVLCGVGNVCAGLDTDRCEVLVRPEGVATESLIFIGSILPTTGTYQLLGAPMQNAIQLAAEDFNSTASLPGNRKVAYVSCDSEGSLDLAVEAANELVAARVSAIIGPGLSNNVVDVANVTAPSGTFLMSPSASAGILAQLNDQNLVWRTTGNDNVQAAGIVARVADLEPTPQRVVALVKNDLYGQGLLEDVAPGLDGVIPPDSLATLVYSEIDSFADSQELLAEYGARISVAFERDPDVVMVLGSVEARELILFYLEAWSAADPRPPLPLFLVSNEALPVLGEVVEGVSDSFKATLMDNLEGVDHFSVDPVNYDPWAIRYGIRFNTDADHRAGLAYDAAMTVLFAIGTLSATGFTGNDIAEAMGRFSDSSADEITFGQGMGFIDLVQDALNAGDDVSLRGISGVLDFDAGSGDCRRDLTGWDVEPISGTLRPTLRARRHFDRAAGVWSDL